MVNTFSSLIFANITNDSVLQEKYNSLLVAYANSLFYKMSLPFDDDYKLLLNYADLLSLSVNQTHQNLAQQICLNCSLKTLR